MPRLRKTDIIAALRANKGMIASAARALRCSYQALYKRLKTDPQLQQVREEAREEILDLAESKLIEKIESGNLVAIMFVLKTLGRSRGYTEHVSIEHTASGEVRIGGVDSQDLATRLQRWIRTHYKRRSNGLDRNGRSG